MSHDIGMLSGGSAFVKSRARDWELRMNEEFNFLFGINPVLEKLKARPNDIAEILIAKGFSALTLQAIEVRAQRIKLPVKYVAPELLDQLSEGQRHQGVVAKVQVYSYSSFSDLLKEVPSLSELMWILILDGLMDPRNFGALLRTAEAVGVHHVVIPKDRAVAVTPTVVKASAGAVDHLKIYRETNLRRVILKLKEIGFWIAGLDPKAAETIYERVYPKRLGIVLGSEGDGIRPLILRECDYLVSIPMRGQITSLNVSVAGAVFLYELLRQVQLINKH
jgi:23S rRNA (guanosine2251-2'-O)-methyltransferase